MEEDPTISDRRVALFRERDVICHVVAALLKSIGAVEIAVESNMISGIATLGTGIMLSKDQPSRWICLFALLLNTPQVYRPFFSSTSLFIHNATAAASFVLGLRISCILMLLRQSFLDRRLDQLKRIPRSSSRKM